MRDKRQIRSECLQFAFVCECRSSERNYINGKWNKISLNALISYYPREADTNRLLQIIAKFECILCTGLLVRDARSIWKKILRISRTDNLTGIRRQIFQDCIVRSKLIYWCFLCPLMYLYIDVFKEITTMKTYTAIWHVNLANNGQLSWHSPAIVSRMPKYNRSRTVFYSSCRQRAEGPKGIQGNKCCKIHRLRLHQM